MTNENSSLVYHTFVAFDAVYRGCYNQPVQHLASDAALIKAGKSTKKDVLLLLGEPDAQQLIGQGVEEWVYYEEEMSMMQRTPLVGELFEPKGYSMIRIVLENDIVQSCDYSGYEAGESKWSDDYGWQNESK